MIKSANSILVVQTAFIGDAILTLPLVQALHKLYKNASIDVAAVPRAAEIFANHPAISKIFSYDKRGADKGIKGFLRLLSELKDRKYDLIVVPHRSLRSAFLTWLLRPALSIGFDKSAGRWLFKEIVRYDPSAHEIDRNLSLLGPLDAEEQAAELPRLYPSQDDCETVSSILKSFGLDKSKALAAIAPGTIWNTKRWPAEKFAELCGQISTIFDVIILIGGKEDEALCREVKEKAKIKNINNLAGKMSLLQSADLIRRSTVLISNDSAPMHIAVAMGTPVVAIFGATVPSFGFAPRGPRDIIVEINGLKCRPCSIHGGDKCPIKTFDCMKLISPELVATEVRQIESGRKN